MTELLEHSASQGKGVSSKHIHQPRGVFTLNTSNTVVATQKEFDALYRSQMQMSDPSYYESFVQPADVLLQVGSMQGLPGDASRHSAGSCVSTKRSYAIAFPDEPDQQYRQTSGPLDETGSEFDEEFTIGHYEVMESEMWFENFLPELPYLEPASQAEGKETIIDLCNPFAEHAFLRHPDLKTGALPSTDRCGQVDGYLKFHFKISKADKHAFVLPPEAANFGNISFGVHHKNIPVSSTPLSTPNPMNCQGLPRAFGIHKMDDMDWHFLRFYLTAFCRGRTLLPKTNLWLRDIAPIAAKKDVVKHSLLALAAGYWLHFSPNETVLSRANYHYSKATELLTTELTDPRSRSVGQDDGIVSAMLLLFIDDAVNYDLRRGKNQESRWRAGSRTLRWVLQQSDPGQRYWYPKNVQCSSARLSNANFAAFVDILAQPVTKLRIEEAEDRRMHGWLLQGSDTDSRKIHGGTGLSPKLLHIFGQITGLCARLQAEPQSRILPHGANAILDMLHNFRQWSELNETGYASTESLLRSCVLDENGQVDCPIKVTDLTAECWVASAKIYLLCRFFRMPRKHPQVRSHVNTLWRCLERMPRTGKLFTSQSPFFCVFLCCLMAANETERQLGRNWFETVTSDISNRSSVPPVYDAVKRLWVWLDDEFVDVPFDEQVALQYRHAWWEAMVDHLLATEGEIALY